GLAALTLGGEMLGLGEGCQMKGLLRGDVDLDTAYEAMLGRVLENFGLIALIVLAVAVFLVLLKPFEGECVLSRTRGSIVIREGGLLMGALDFDTVYGAMWGRVLKKVGLAAPIVLAAAESTGLDLGVAAETLCKGLFKPLEDECDLSGTGGQLTWEGERSNQNA
nr:hypothetical protein [Tanacetum cinerariifolium]